MHSYSVVHRDIKLQNVMMSDDTDKAIPKLVDFGFAKIIGPSDLLNEHYGSHGYTAPEILLKKSYRLEPDIWSLGVLLYSVYAGALPFASYDRKEMDKMVCEDPVEFSEPGFEKASKTALKLIKQMLHKDKKKRPVIEEVLESPFLQQAVRRKQEVNHKEINSPLIPKPKHGLGIRQLNSASVKLSPVRPIEQNPRKFSGQFEISKQQ